MSLPSLSPIQVPDLTCMECSCLLRRVITHRASGKLDRIFYYCDTEKCHYGMVLSPVHANTQNAPYVPPTLKEEVYRAMSYGEVKEPVPSEARPGTSPDADKT